MQNDKLLEAYKLQQRIKTLEEQLKEKKDEYKTLIHEIREHDLTSEDYEIVRIRNASYKPVVSYFREHYPDLYLRSSHVSHANAIKILSEKYGSYEIFQQWLRGQASDKYDACAIITCEDIRDYAKKSGIPIDYFVQCGGMIKDADKDEMFVISPMTNFTKEIRKEIEEMD